MLEFLSKVEFPDLKGSPFQRCGFLDRCTETIQEDGATIECLKIETQRERKNGRKEERKYDYSTHERYK